jgi:uncharacterized membrane protein
MLGRVLAIVAGVLFIIATILAWLDKHHADAFAYAGLAFLAGAVACMWLPWVSRGSSPVNRAA